MKRDLSAHDVFVAQVRALQAIHDLEHAALENWAAWSRSGIGKPKLARDKTFDQFNRSACDPDGWGEPSNDVERAPQTLPAQAEPPEVEPYDEVSAKLLDQRLHCPGGICQEYREVLKVLYIHRVPEYQAPRLAGRVSEDEFRYRLEQIYSFVRRFI